MNHCPPPRLNVLVRHPDPIVRAGLLAALRANASQDISVHEASDRSPNGEPTIDVVVTDYDNAMQLSDPGTRKAQGGLADARILAVTANDREADIRRAIQAGIHGYLLLGGTLDEFVDGVRKVGRGARCLCPVVAERIAESLAGDALTTREHEVLQLVITGQSNKVIARQLTIELGTVKSHMRAIMTKLGATSRTQAAGIALSRGLVDEFRPAHMATFASRPRAIEAGRQFA
ncbi:response regulator transcription factor [Variovorax paradoxus]|uniref:response regulator transcription factor n=1 Tax=Variovorax paradoxus TaxID=34073 RepID=UPI0005ABB7EC|nr:response regulator transcription factor [Variovorax paradoxus]